jgi:hypothetical protein
MDLTTEDQLRLNVLLAHAPQAIRIDESTLTVLALADGNEARITLNPNCRGEQYLKHVRELLSYHALGSPGGYPVFLQRWTRMGQHREGQLDKLLLLGEPEAVVAVAGAPGLTPELAQRVWWLMPESDIARRMLAHDTVADSDLGRTLAAHLVEHLAFETEPLTVIETIRLVLRPGLISDESRRRIWNRGNHRNAYRLGFLDANPDELPELLPPRAGLDASRARLQALANAGNAPAALLARLLDGPGQTFLATAEELLRHPVDKYVTARLLNTIGAYFAAAAGLGDDDPALAALQTIPECKAEIAAMRTLAPVNESVATPVLAKTTAEGTLLKRKLEPVTAPILAQLAVLRGG